MNFGVPEGWPDVVGDRFVLVIPAHDLPDSVDGLKPRRRYVVTLEDIEYVDSDGDVVTTIRRENAK